MTLRILDNSLGERENWNALGYHRSSGAPERQHTCHLCNQTKWGLVWGYQLPDLRTHACADCINRRIAEEKEQARKRASDAAQLAEKQRRQYDADQRFYSKLFADKGW